MYPRAIALAMLCCIGAPCGSPAIASYRSYEVRVVNLSSVEVQVELTQYHAADFGSTRPGDFVDELRLRTKAVDLPAKERTVVRFNDATGGYWIRWCQLKPVVVRPHCGTLDLVRDKREIRIGRSHAV